jgi:nodulation protein E
MRRVAVTGFGAVSGFGVGVPALWQGLVAGQSVIRPITMCETQGLANPIAAEVPGFSARPIVTEERSLILDRFAEFALVAAAEAVKAAGLDLTDEERARAGVAIGTGIGGAGREEEAYYNVYVKNVARIHPFTIPRIMYNAAASHVSMAQGFQGPTICISTACASASHAIGEAAEMIRAGRADVMLAGGADAPIAYGIMRAWDAMRVLAPPLNGDPSRACRPFSRDRQGFVLGEGAGLLVLEEWERAVRRGATIHAELAGYGATADAGHITAPGIEAPARAITTAFAQAGVSPDQIQYVNAHGTATRLNDSTETTIIKRAFGDHARRLAISSTKSMHGHAMGASGGLEAIATVLTITHGIVPPTANYTEPDPECDLDYVPNHARQLKVDAAISNSFAFGGLNAVLLLRQP